MPLRNNVNETRTEFMKTLHLCADLLHDMSAVDRNRKDVIY